MSTRKFRLRKARKADETPEPSSESPSTDKVAETRSSTPAPRRRATEPVTPSSTERAVERRRSFCLLYTSDAADE